MVNRLLTIALTTTCISGCASLSPETRVEESAYQVAVALDTAQTISMVGRHPDRFIEADELHINGYHPNTREILTYQLSMGAIHYGVTWLLSQGQRDTWKVWALRAWEGFGLGVEVGAIRNNYNTNGGNFFPTCKVLACGQTPTTSHVNFVYNPH